MKFYAVASPDHRFSTGTELEVLEENVWGEEGWILAVDVNDPEIPQILEPHEYTIVEEK